MYKSTENYHTSIILFDKISEANHRKAVESFLLPERTKSLKKLPRNMEYLLPPFKEEPKEESPKQRPIKTIRHIPRINNNC